MARTRARARVGARRWEGGGLFSDRPGRTLRLFGVLPVDRDAGLGLVYSAAIAGWTYLCAWGALHALGVGNARQIGGALGAAAGVLLLVELTRARQPAGSPAPE